MKAKFNITRLSDVQPESVRWFWEPYIPKGAITFLEGDPGLGKSWISMSLAAAASNGKALPTEPSNILRPKRNVIFLAAEDDPSYSLRPRLDSLKADVSRIFLFEGITDAKGKEIPFDFNKMEMLEALVEELKPSFIVIDPVHEYIGSSVDIYRANEVRPLLAKLAKLARKHDIAVLCLRHITKGDNGKALYRGQGSIDFTAAARSVLLVGYNPNTAQTAMAHIKSNIGPLGNTLAFKSSDTFQWLGPTNSNAADLLTSEPQKKSSRRSIPDLVREAKSMLIEDFYTIEDLRAVWQFNKGRTDEVLTVLEKDGIVEYQKETKLWLVNRERLTCG